MQHNELAASLRDFIGELLPLRASVTVMRQATSYLWSLPCFGGAHELEAEHTDSHSDLGDWGSDRPCRMRVRSWA